MPILKNTQPSFGHYLHASCECHLSPDDSSFAKRHLAVMSTKRLNRMDIIPLPFPDPTALPPDSPVPSSQLHPPDPSPSKSNDTRSHPQTPHPSPTIISAPAPTTPVGPHTCPDPQPPHHPIPPSQPPPSPPSARSSHSPNHSARPAH